MEGDLEKFFLISSFLFSMTVTNAFASLVSGGWNDELEAPTSVHSLIRNESHFALELGLEYLHPTFSGMSGIIVDNPKISSTTTYPKSNLENTYPEVFLQTLKAQAVLSSESRWTITLKTYLPLNSATELNTGNIYLPEFVLYRAEAQRPRIFISSGRNFGPDWRLGLGIDVGFSIHSQANVYLQSGTNTYSDQTISAKVKPSLIPQASLQYTNYTVTVRAENKSTFDLDTSAVARVFGDLNGAAANYNYHTQSALYYQPWEFELSGKNALSDSFQIKWALGYQLWSGYQAHAALMTAPVPNSCSGGITGGNCTSTFSPTQSPDFHARNLLIPEVTLEWSPGEGHFLGRTFMGYRYKDSIFSDLPKGNTNYLDPPRHDLLWGAVFPFKSRMELKVNAQVSRLVSQNVVKSNPTTDIGGPGYSVSGWVYGGGMSLAIPFKE